MCPSIDFSPLCILLGSDKFINSPWDDSVYRFLEKFGLRWMMYLWHCQSSPSIVTNPFHISGIPPFNLYFGYVPYLADKIFLAISTSNTKRYAFQGAGYNEFKVLLLQLLSTTASVKWWIGLCHDSLSLVRSNFVFVFDFWILMSNVWVCLNNINCNCQYSPRK